MRLVSYAIPLQTAGDVAVHVHVGMQPLSVVYSTRTGFVLSAFADPSQPVAPLVFRVLKSSLHQAGDEVPDMRGFRFLASVELGGGLLFYHVFVRVP